MASRWAKQTVRAFASADRVASSVVASARSVAGGFFSNALTLDEKSTVSVELAGRWYAQRATPSGLLGWERRWYQAVLPPPPGRILLGAAGVGREAVDLANMGYAVDAFEPAPQSAQACAHALGPRGRCVTASYEQVSAHVLDGADLPALATSYDAAILGWISFNCVLDAAERARVLAAYDRLCPTGPILASVWLAQSEQRGRARAARVGAALGRSVARVRGIPADAERLDFGYSYGFTHWFSREEIHALAESIGRDVQWGSADAATAHVTLLPRANEVESRA